VIAQFLGAEEGQSILLIAGGFAMLMAAAAFSIDWGYTYAQHRAMTNASQAAALAAGRMLATSVDKSSSTSSTCATAPCWGFPAASEEDVYVEACKYVLRNMGLTVTSSSYSLTIELWGWTSSSQTLLGTRTSTSPFTFATGTSTDCHKPTPPSPTPIPTIPSTSNIDVKVIPSVTFGSLFGSVIGSPTDSAVGAARARVVGGQLSLSNAWGGGTPWATVSHYDPSAFSQGFCSNPCDPTTTQAVAFWDTGVKYGQFKGLIDFSRSSTEPIATDLQLFTSWDTSGSIYVTPPTTWRDVPGGLSITCNQTGVPSGKWDTSGNDANDKQCSIPLWTYYGFRGYYGIGMGALSTDWSASADPNAPLNKGCPPGVPCREAPSDIGARPSVCPLPSSLSILSAPSCGTQSQGDWAETNTTGDVGQNMAKPLCAVFAAAFSQPWVQTNQFSASPLPNGTNSACDGNPGYVSGTYGRALVVAAYLWDCAEKYDKSKLEGNRWSLNVGASGDCARTSDWTGNPTPDRVHLFTVVPFTFYEGLVGSQSIQGFWGGGFSSADSCPLGNCGLTQFTNTTLLVGE
jgi:hypothetical protein